MPKLFRNGKKDKKDLVKVYKIVKESKLGSCRWNIKKI